MIEIQGLDSIPKEINGGAIWHDTFITGFARRRSLKPPQRLTLPG
jgi:hypothetical protein